MNNRAADRATPPPRRPHRETIIGAIGRRRRRRRVWPSIFAGLLAGAICPAHAQDAEFQAFFFAVCTGSPTGALAARCAETPGGGGDLSADSEESLDPSQTLSLNSSALARARAVGKEIQARLEQGRDSRDGGSPDSRFSALVHARWEGVDREATAAARGLDGDLWGAQFGFDVRLSDDSFVGWLFSYDRGESEFDADQPGVNFTPPANDGTTDADSLSVTFYGSHRFSESTWIDGSLGYGRTDYDLRRSSVFQESSRVVPQTNVNALAETDGEQIAAGIGIGRDGSRGALGGGVYGRMNLVRAEIDGYRETDGSGLQMRAEGETHRSLSAILGLQGSHTSSRSWGVLIVQGRVEYEREFEDEAQSVTTRFVLDADGTAFDVTGDEADQDVVNAAVGLLFVLPRGWITFAEVEVLAGHAFLDRQRATIGLRKDL